MKPVGTVITTEESPSTSEFSFVFDPEERSVKKGQYIQTESEQGIVFGYIGEIFRSNRYFERAESVAEYERVSSMKENFPTSSWEYIIAQVKVLGVSKSNSFVRASIPPVPGAKVFSADSELLKSFLGLKDNGLMLGKIQHHEVDANIDMTRLVQKHFAILAMSGAGKCVAYDTPVMLADGTHKKIGVLADEAFSANPTITKDGVEIAFPKGKLQVLSLKKDLKLVKNSAYAITRRRSPASLVAFRTRTGRKITITKEHPLLAISESGPEWKKAGELKNNMYLAVPRELSFGNTSEINLLEFYRDSESMRIFDKDSTLRLKKKLAEKKMHISRATIYQLDKGCMPVRKFRELCDKAGCPNLFHNPKRIRHCNSESPLRSKLALNRDMGRFAGYLMGDGHIGRNNAELSALIPEIREDFRVLCETLFGLAASAYPTNVRVHSKTLACVLTDVFGVTSSSGSKYVSDAILSANREFAAGFLSGLFDTDGSVSLNKPEIEYCTKSTRLASGVSLLLLKFGICSIPKIRHNKKYGRNYNNIFVRGSANLMIFKDEISFTSNKKRLRLEKRALCQPNTNIDVIPSAAIMLSRIMPKLRISESETARRAGIANNFSRYRTGENALSRRTFAMMAKALSARANELRLLCTAANSIQVPPENKKTILRLCNRIKNSQGIGCRQIAAHCKVSAATVQRMLVGRTETTDLLFDVGKGLTEAASHCGTGELENMLQESEILNSMDINALFNIAESAGISYESLDERSNLWKGAWASFRRNERHPSFEAKISMINGLRITTAEILEDLQTCEDDLRVISDLADSSIFWDKIEEVKEVAAAEEYVYDLAMKSNHNFIAGDLPLFLHNSHLSTVLIEELLDRKKEDGRIAVVVIDIHGEYMGFSDSVYASRTKVIEVGDRKRGFAIPFRKVSPEMIEEWLPILSYPQKALLRTCLMDLRAQYKKERKPYGTKELMEAIDASADSGARSSEKSSVKPALKRSLQEIFRMRMLSSNRENPKLFECMKPGNLLVLDFSDVDNLRKKQVIVSLIARKLFNLRKKGKIPPFLLIVEEAHNFAKEKAEAYEAVSRSVIETIAREGRKFGASLCLITQRPVNLSTTALSQCNTHIILRVTNPNDLDHIQMSSEGIDARIAKSITSLRVGEGIIVGEATNAPIFVDIRNIKTRKKEKGRPLAELAAEYEKSLEKKDEDAEAFL